MILKIYKKVRDLGEAKDMLGYVAGQIDKGIREGKDWEVCDCDKEEQAGEGSETNQNEAGDASRVEDGESVEESGNGSQNAPQDATEDEEES